MEDQEKSVRGGYFSERDQIQSAAETANPTGDVQGNKKEENISYSAPNIPQELETTKRPLPESSVLFSPPLSTRERRTNDSSAIDEMDKNSEPSKKKFKSGDSSDSTIEAQATTQPTTSASQNSNTPTDANYSIATGYATANQPPTPPPSAASTATNASSIAPADSPTAVQQSASSSPRKTSVSSFDTASGWTDDEAYERMPKTPVAPPQSSASRRAFRHNTMSPLPGSGGVFLPDVPPAPPTTPAAKQTATLPFQADLGMTTPLPYAAGFVQNAKELEQQQKRRSDTNVQEQNQQIYNYEQQHQHELPEGAATPAPPRSQQSSPAKPPAKPTTALSDDFSEWAVGDRYKLSRMLGRGSYGEVAQAIDLYQRRPDAFVAIKRIVGPFDQEVDAVRLFREIHILRRLRTLGKNDCIVPLLDVVQPPTDDLNDFHDLYLVFDYVDTDLYKLIMSPQYLTTEHIQTFLYQMLIGLKYIHSGNVIHRDLKPANILLNEDCSLKICDFGLARIVDEMSVAQDHSSTSSSPAVPSLAQSPPKKFNRSCSVSEEILSHDEASVPVSKLPLTRQLTKHVVTRWYRAPELILIQPYTTAVDVWSLGCIFAELLSMQEGSVPGYQDRSPLFPGGACYPLSGDTDNAERLDQLNVIFNVIGTPSKEDIAHIGSANEYIKNMKPIKPKNLKDIYPAADPNALDLLNMMLKFNPKERCTAGEALNHSFFAGIRREEMETSVESPMESPAFLNEQEIDIETLKRMTYNEVLWFRDNQTRPTPPPTLPTVTQTDEDFTSQVDLESSTTQP